MVQIGKKEGRVPLSIDVITKCICDTCPVQGMSSCAKPKIEKMRNIRSMSHMKEEKSSGMPSGMSMSLAASPPKEKMDVNSAEIAGPYCASGIASCRDLNQKKSCICPGCQVYKDYNLLEARPVEHFCFNDKAI